MACEDGGREQTFICPNPGTLSIGGKAEAGRQPWNWFCLRASRRNQTCCHFDLGFILPEEWDNTFLLL
jgi:hypothetical protein